MIISLLLYVTECARANVRSCVRSSMRAYIFWHFGRSQSPWCGLCALLVWWMPPAIVLADALLCITYLGCCFARSLWKVVMSRGLAWQALAVCGFVLFCWWKASEMWLWRDGCDVWGRCEILLYSSVMACLALQAGYTALMKAAYLIFISAWFSSEEQGLPACFFLVWSRFVHLYQEVLTFGTTLCLLLDPLPHTDTLCAPLLQYGRSALHIARRENKHDVVRLLEQHAVP